MPIHDIISYYTLICPLESEQCGEEGKKLRKFEHLENENYFFDEINNIFEDYLSFGGKIKNSEQKL